jgi:molecular chaperone DnaK
VVIDQIVEAHGQGALAPTPLSTSFGKAADPKAKAAASPSWRAQKSGAAGWAPSPLPRPTSNASLLPRRASRVFGTGEIVLPPLAELTTAPEEPPAPAGTEGEGGPHPSGLALPRKRSSVPRPWATGRPGENTDRIRVRELLPKGRPDVEPGPTQRINTPPPIALGDRESDRTLRLDVRELGTPENLPTLPPRSPVGEAHVPNREFGTGEQGTGELSAGDISLPPVKGGTSDLHIEEVPSGLEGDAFVPEAVVTPANSLEEEANETPEPPSGLIPSVALASSTTVASDPAEAPPHDTDDLGLAVTQEAQDHPETPPPLAPELYAETPGPLSPEALSEPWPTAPSPSLPESPLPAELQVDEPAPVMSEPEPSEPLATAASPQAPELSDSALATPLDQPAPQPLAPSIESAPLAAAAAETEASAEPVDEPPAPSKASTDTADASPVPAPDVEPGPALALSRSASWAEALGLPPTVPPRPATPAPKPFDELQTLSNLERPGDSGPHTEEVPELHGLSGDLGPTTQVIERPNDEVVPAPDTADVASADVDEASADVEVASVDLAPPIAPIPDPRLRPRMELPPPPEDLRARDDAATPASRAAPVSMMTPLPEVQALPPIEPPRALFSSDEPAVQTADPRPVAPVQSVQISDELAESEPVTSLADAAASLGLDLAEVRARAVTDAATEIVSTFQAPRAPSSPGAGATFLREEPTQSTSAPPRRDSPGPRTESAPRPEGLIRPSSAPGRNVSAPGRTAPSRASSVPGGFSAQVSVTGVENGVPSESGEFTPESPRPPPRVGPFRPVIERDQASGHEDPATMLQAARAAAFSEEATEVPPERDPAPAPATNLLTEKKPASPTPERGTGDLPGDKSRVVGIDLGAHWVRIGIMEHGELELIPVGGASYFPALVAARVDGSLVVGAKARSILHDEPARVVSPLAVLRAFKAGALDPHRAGIRVVSHEGLRLLIKLGDRTIDFGEVLISFFSALKGAVAAHLGNERFRALIAVPPDLDPAAQQLLEKACQEARLRVARFVPEAEAMLQAYNLEEHPVESVLLVDVGIGHLAAALARRQKGSLQVVDAIHDEDLAASLIDQKVADLTLEELATKAGEDHRQDPVARVRLVEAIEFARLDIKRMATVDLKVTLPAPGGAAGVGVERSIKLPRSRIYQVTEGLVRDILAKVQELLKRQNVDPRAIGAVVIAGSGGTYPPLMQAFAQLTQKEPLFAIPSTQVFALGLARAGVALERVEVTGRPDTLHASIGMELPGGRFRPLLSAGAKLPATLEKLYPSSKDNQSELELKLYQGDAEFVRSCTPLGTLLLSGLPKGDRGSIKIALRLEVAADGVLTARLQEPSEGLEHNLVLATAQTPEARKKALPTPRPPIRRPEAPAKANPGFFGRLFKK